jgi:hypothetical protein
LCYQASLVKEYLQKLFLAIKKPKHIRKDGVPMGSFRKLKACATLFLVLAASFSWASEVHAEFSVEVNRLLVFFKDVLMIDTSQCTVSVPNEHGDNSPALGTRGEKGGKITLVFNGGGSVDSLFEFKGEFLTWCLIYYGYEGSNPIPYLQTQSDNHLDLARGFLERYRVFTNDPTVDAMSEMLTTNNGAHKLPQNMGNMKMTISEDVSPDFSWSYTFEGEDYRLLSVSFFSSPHIFSFGDDRYRYNMDSSAFPRYEPESPTPNSRTCNF